MVTDASWDIHDPLTLNTRRQLDYLFKLIPSDSPLVSAFQNALSGNALLSTLSRYMLRPSLTLAIAWSFRPLLMDLCARWLDDDEDIYGKLEALGLLIEVHEELYPILSSFLRQSHFEDGPLGEVLDGRHVEQLDTRFLQRLLLTYYRILRATPLLSTRLNWDLSLLLKLCTTPHPDRAVRWLAIRCYALQSNISEHKREDMERNILGEIGLEDCLLSYGEDISGTVKEVDGWILPVLEMKRIQEYRTQLLSSPDYFSSEDSDVVLKDRDLSPRIVNVLGILLLRSPSPPNLSSTLVLTSSALISLRKLAVNISLRRPTLLTSAPSSGKTAFLNHLALLLYPSTSNHIVTIHLADTSLDPRSLLGSYVSSSAHSGSFEWKDGVLVKAMREGKWVVFKDIDRASSEVLGLIVPLVESLDDTRSIGTSAQLSVANRGIIEAAESFSIFATRAVERHETATFPPASFLGAQKWQEVIIPENSLSDLRLIVDSKFPKIAGPVTDCLIDIWQSAKRLRLLSSTRPIGICDLEKFCSRVSHLLESNHSVPSQKRASSDTPVSLMALLPHPSLREEIYLEARDVFFAAGATNKSFAEQRDAIAMMIGEKLALSEETREWLLKRRTPVFELEKDVDGRSIAVKAGRTVLSVDPVNSLSKSSSSRPFGMYKQAIRLMAQLAACVSSVEPVLLTGETGTGKTSVISHLASLLNRPLISLNLSNQTESSDLIGGFKPVSARVPALELQQRFTDLFQKTFSSKKNETFHQSLRKAVAEGKWRTAVKLWGEASKMATSKLKEKRAEDKALTQSAMSDNFDTPLPRKRRKLQTGKSKTSESDWSAFQADVRHFEVQHVLDKGKFAFHYVEGPLVKAIRTGAWVLLDEINLAPSETLECISSILQGPHASVTLTEQGSLEPVPRHLNFRLFACMNPATDVGKKDLPSNIRARFTEIEVLPPDDDQEALLNVISHYIGYLTVMDKTAIFDIAQFYLGVKRLSESGKIADGSDHRPHYSMRTLSRALTFAVDTVQTFGLRRALWEGFTMAFTMVLDQASADIVLDHARRTLLSSVKNTAHFLSQQPPSPKNSSVDSPVQLGPFWLSSGPNEREDVSDYILTPSVQKKLVDLGRIVMTNRYPILIEGPTSSGKTSAIQYLARRTGHTFVRINNHEHTDIQEYLGSYVSDPTTGKLVFRDGLLVRALRRGDWIVLDELNLAPTDVLEALNRLLDDNRELVIPETQEVVRPHPHFMLFATQNPSGVYAGRKVLSRALRNRFLEVHFKDVPQTELEHILCQRARIAPSYSQRIVAVFHELQKRRQVGRIFEGKEGFATLRDLFRWAGRDAQGYQELAENGYMLLAERTRHEEDKIVVKEVIEKVMKVTISEDTLYNIGSIRSALESDDKIVWTKPMQRLFVLLSRALYHNEPVLLVGDTGSGKTSVCQVYAEAQRQILRTVNCHQNTEASDIIGGLRPVRRESSLENAIVREAVKLLDMDVGALDRNQILIELSSRLSTDLSPSERKTIISAQTFLSSSPGLFGWQDGPLVTCMRSADVFLLDEISLADDSVLERLNSVLEPSRTLVLAERGGESTDEFHIVAEVGFKFVATMNPGGDFGKKELSPALRNRFTEIWVPSVMKRDDLSEIVKHSWKHETLTQLTDPLLDFVDWILEQIKDTSVLTLRDILSWITFCNNLCTSSNLPPSTLFVHGGQMAVVDGLSSLSQLSTWSASSLQDLRRRAARRLEELGPGCQISEDPSREVSVGGGAFCIGPFSLALGALPPLQGPFNFKAPTSLENAFRLIRACQITKPILLEGSPGVGKTSLVSALAAAAGQQLCRINLSEQTDLVDLFGSDLPAEGNAAGKFVWTDAEFLQALKNGYWVLLDEMNLASQSVLEGLNAVFDHRGTVYVPELDRSFSRHPNFRVFAAQNPLNQGSGRKGLPKSFLNRFTKVFVEQLSASDLLLICRHLFPNIPLSTLQLMIDFNCQLHDEVVVKQEYGILGSPWEFNLRDIIRWASLMERPDNIVDEPWMHLNTVYRSRFRCEPDRRRLVQLYADVFGDADVGNKLQPRHIVTPDYTVCGSSFISRGNFLDSCRGARLLASKSESLEAALASISHAWLLIITGPQSIGKTSFVRCLASVAAQPLQELSLGSSSDTSDLIGSFEQVDSDHHFRCLLARLFQLIDKSIAQAGFAEFATSLESLLKLKKEAINASQSRSIEALTDVARVAMAYSPSYTSKEHLKTSMVALESSISAEKSGPRFEWIDGPLVLAMKNGDWLLLDNANLCSPSVLDRLNSLCEIGGSLVLTEKGVDQEIITPHRDFRLIMTVDPHRGEISRAMRNRGIEVALDADEVRHDVGTLLDAQRLPLSAAIAQSASMYSRSAFELTRRALLPAIQSQPDGFSLFYATELVYNDILSSQIGDFKTLIVQCESSLHDALVVVLLGSSNGLHFRHTLRLLKSLDIPRCSSLYKDLSLLLCKTAESSKVLVAELTGNIETPYSYWPNARNRLPFLPFLAAPFINWLSEDALKACKLTSILLEAHTLAIIMERRLQEQKDKLDIDIAGDSSYATDRILSMVHEDVGRFLTSIPMLVRKMLLYVESGKKDSLQCSQLVLRLVHYAQHLCRAVNQHTADFSTLYAVSDWIYDCVKDAPEPIQELEKQAKALRHGYILISGQRILEIWNSFHRPALSSEGLALMQKFGSLLLEPSLGYRSRWRMFEFVSLFTLGSDLDGQDNEDWRRLKTEVDVYLDPAVDKFRRRQSMLQSSASLALLAVELDGLACSSPFQNKLGLRELMRVVIQSCAFPLHLPRMISYQQLLWKIEAKKDIIPGLVQVHLEWHRAVWKEDELLQTSGPSAFFTPIQLQSTVIARRKSVDAGTLNNLFSLDVQIDDEIRRSLIECSQLFTREKLVVSFLLQNIVMILYACCPSLLEDQSLQDALKALTLSPGSQESITSIMDVLHGFKDPLFSKAFGLLVLSLNELASSSTWPDRLHALGHCWIMLSRTLLFLYVPNLSLDPVEVQGCRDSYRKAQETWIREQIYVHSSLESIKTGNHSNVFTQLLRDRLQDLEGEFGFEDSSNKPGRKSDFALLHSFWKETRTFLGDIVSSERTEKFISAAYVSNKDLYSQELLLQNSISNFLQRMSGAYVPLQDLLPAIELGLMQFRFGLRTIRHAMLLRSPQTSGPFLTEIMTFPSARARKALLMERTESIAQGEFSLGSALLLKFVGVARSISRDSGLQPVLKDIEVLYEQFSSLWNSELDKEAEKVRQSESLYRSRQVEHKADEDADLEDKDVERLFPTFSETDADLDTYQEHKKPPSNDVHALDIGIRRELMKVHLQLFDSDFSSAGDLQSLWNSMRLQMISSWTDGHLSSMSCDMDQGSLAFRLDLLRLSKRRFQENADAKAHSFYHDSNLPEARKASKLVRSLLNDLDKLICDWPDQLVLQHLRDRCESVLSMSVRSPVAKVLGALERLLLHTEDWEMFANRENSLKSHRHSLTALIVEWRKLELTGWRFILDFEAESFLDGLAEWWFRLYDAAVRGAIAAGLGSPSSPETALDNYLDNLAPLLEDFVISSPLGQFKERLRLIRSFSKLTSNLASVNDGPSRTALKRSSDILTSIHLFYDQFSIKIGQSLAERRAAIEKDVQSLVQLATWRDVNVHALQQSAQRSHKQLYKRIRKFRELLRQPISDKLQVGSTGTDDDSGILFATNAGQSPVASSVVNSVPFPVTNDASRVFKKFVSVLSVELNRLTIPSSSSAIEDLCSSVFTIQEEFIRSKSPEGLSVAARKRWNASLLTRRRRSWNELLKELKRIGISPNVKPEILQMHRSKRRVMEQPALNHCQGTSFGSVLRMVDLYFYRSVGLLSDLQQCTAEHHSDIPTRELQRGIAFFESAFSYALSTRSRIVALLGAWDRLHSCTCRLRELEHSRSTCTGEYDIYVVLLKAKLKAFEFADSLDEISRVADSILKLSEPEASIEEVVLNDIRHWKSTLELLGQQLCDLSQKVEGCAPFLFSEGDVNSIRMALGQFDSADAFLARLAQRERRLSRFCYSIHSWHSSLIIDSTSLHILVEPTNLPCDAQRLTDLLLVIAQDLLAIETKCTDGSEPDDTNHIRLQLSLYVDIAHALKIDTLLGQIGAFSSQLQKQSPSNLGNALRQILPFLDQYLAFLERHLIQHVSWTKSLFKLTYLTGSLIRNVAQSGFCRPPDQEDSDQLEGKAETADGTGLGEGAGSENVSMQIEDESQYEGVKDQDDEMGGRQNEDAGDDALDVDFDLAGELEDAPEQDPKGEDDDGDEVMSNLDDEFGHNICDELNPVDEKFWNDQPEDSDAQAQDVNDGQAQKGEESEMVAKEQDNQPDKGQPKADSDDSEPTKDQQDRPEESEVDAQAKEDSQMNDIGEGRDAENANVTDLPSQRDVSEDAAQPEESRRDNLDEAAFDEELKVDEEQQGDGIFEAVEEIEGQPGVDQAPVETTEEPLEQADSQGIANADVHSGAGADGDVNAGNDDTLDSRESDTQPVGESVADLPPSAGNESSQLRSTGDRSEATECTDSARASEANQNTVTRGTESGKTSTDLADTPLTNPYRSLGDALCEVHRRFDEIKNSSEGEVAGAANGSDMNQSIGLEYAPEDSMNVDMQALGPAIEEEHAKLDRLNVLEENYETRNGAAPPESPRSSLQDISQRLPDDASRFTPLENDQKGSVGHAGEGEKTAELDTMEVDEVPQTPGEAELSDASVDEQESGPDKTVELQVNKWRREGQPVEDGQRIWQLYDSLTQSLSFSLCEQLRLILEPTRATRLMGDFRTGKRLNMKKIIPYIASNYTKDKIWLRRVRPSQREYQVLIALDDSRSMAESHSIHLAFQTLALVSKALNRLEVGDLAIASFGESMRLLHGFDDGPFTDQTGTKVVEAFRFQQTATDVRSLLESSVEVLMKARERRISSSSSDLWQLEIIISDGICQDHGELRAIMRKAEEEHILVVFIVIDARDDSSLSGPIGETSHSQNSIIHMNQATYRTVNGRLELHMQRYLDSFPFEFFVILKSVEALPDVLADTLRQFFERISAS